jgi:hypothetical protein
MNKKFLACSNAANNSVEGTPSKLGSFASLIALHVKRWTQTGKRTMQIKFTLLAVVLTGCATTTYAPSSSPIPATTNTAMPGASNTSAVFIRERAEPTAWNVAVLIDDHKVASISNRSFSSFVVQPGKHSFKIAWPFLAGQIDLKGNIEFLPSETAYFLITGKYTFTGASAGAIQYNTSVALIPLNRTEAEKILGGLSAK